MSERSRGEGNTDAPRVDTAYGERGDDGSGSAPRRVGDVRQEREHEREEERKRRESELGTSWVSVILGWLAALGASLILSGIVSVVVGGILGAVGLSQQGATSGGLAGLIGVVVTLLLAFIVGGYVAGRLASRSGVKHGLLVPLLMLVVTLILAIVGAVVGASFIDQLSGVTLPGPAQSATQGLQQPQNLGTILSVSGIVALLSMFVGGAIGGAWGAKTGRNRP